MKKLIPAVIISALLMSDPTLAGYDELQQLNNQVANIINTTAELNDTPTNRTSIKLQLILSELLSESKTINEMKEKYLLNHSEVQQLTALKFGGVNLMSNGGGIYPGSGN